MEGRFALQHVQICWLNHKSVENNVYIHKPLIMRCIFTGDGAGVGKGRTVAGKFVSE